MPLKALLSCFGRIGFRGYTQEDLVDKGEGPITLSPTNIIDNRLSLQKCSYISWEKYYESPEIMLNKGDIVFVKTASVGKCAIYNSNELATVNPQFVVFKNIKCDVKYLFYSLISPVIQTPISLSNFGSVIGTITQNQLLTYRICEPNIFEQKRIVDFLDAECGRIDAVIEQTRASTEEYKKLKQSVITEAVTKGIRQNRPMKDSGAEWIGEIPEDWECKPIKYVAVFQPSCDTSHLQEDSEITYTPMDCIKNGYFVPNTATYGTVTPSLTPFENGDIAMAKVTPCFENGNIAIMDNLASGFGMGSSELFVYRPVAINARYLLYWLQNDLFKQEACATMTGTGGLKRVSPYFAKHSVMTVPSEEEQTQIVVYLDEKCREMDRLIEAKQQLLTELEAYKKSLIFEYVTGKKEVK